MAVFRVHKDRNYTVMSNHHLRDDRLSLKACGLMSKMLSLPDDWEFTVKGLSTLCKDGVTSIRSGLEELEAFGYVELHEERVGGRFRTVWDIHEIPVESEEWRDVPATEYESQMTIPGIDEEREPEEQEQEPEPEEQAQTAMDLGLRPEPKAEPDVKALKAKGRGRKRKAKPESRAEETSEVVGYLNERTGKRFNPRNEKTRKQVRARMREGYTVQDFRTVIDRKVADWGRDRTMRKFLRPETLFGTKFEGYLNEDGGSSGRYDQYNG